MTRVSSRISRASFSARRTTLSLDRPSGGKYPRRRRLAPGFEGSQDYDLNLRVFERIAPERIRHIPKVLYHWRAVEGSTALDGSQKSYAYAAGLRALEEYVRAHGLPAKAEELPAHPITPFGSSCPSRSRL